MMHDQASFPRK